MHQEMNFVEQNRSDSVLLQSSANLCCMRGFFKVIPSNHPFAAFFLLSTNQNGRLGFTRNFLNFFHRGWLQARAMHEINAPCSPCINTSSFIYSHLLLSVKKAWS